MHGFQKHTRSRRIALLILFLAIIIPLTGCDHPEQDNNSAVARAAVLTADPEHSFLLDILSTGKSDCLLFRADGHTVLIDTADTDDVTVILSHLYRLGITRLDYLILTHFDNDHVGGAAGIVSAIPVGEILAPNYIRRSSACLALEDAIQEKGVPLTRMAEGRTLVLGEATLQIDTTSLFGSDILSSESDGGDDIDENNFSLVTYLTYGSFSALLLGDAQKARLEEYAAAHPTLTADFVKLPHHGTYTKALRRLLESTHPRCTAVCVDSPERPDSRLTELFAGQFSDVSLYLTCQGVVHLAGNASEWVFWQENPSGNVS